MIDATLEERYLKNIKDTIQNAPGTSGAVLSLFSGSIATGTASTGANLFVKGSQNLTIMIDLTGSVATAVTVPTIDVFGGISGFAFAKLRSVTATADQAIAFKLGDANASTGSDANVTGAIAFNDIRIDITTSATVTAGSITVRARAIFPKV